METALDKLITPFIFPFNGSQRIYWLYLYGAFVIGILVFFRQKNINNDMKSTSLFSYLFPKEIYTHRSAINDYGFFYINTVLKALIFFPLIGYLTPAIKDFIDSSMAYVTPSLYGIVPGDNIITSMMFTILSLLFMDFAIFLAHYWQHKNPWLWEFHKVHHSAEVLTPLTVYRMHPVDDILTASTIGILNGLLLGIFYFLTAGDASLILIFGLNAFFFLFYLFGYNLRHSHIWVDYGPALSKFFISPAQHQVHHSAEERHHDKNMGFIFSVWDRLFGTLYIPRGRETFSLGLTNSEHRDFNHGLLRLYFRPVFRVVKMIKDVRLFSSPSVMQVSLFLLIIIPTIAISQNYSTSLAPVKHRVYLEEMTWMEVKDEIANGKTTVIVPTGGTEQNGPHVILGKHNKIIYYTTGRIAEQLGNALVAPVISYVPEGSINQPDGHMRFPGTISIPEPVFESLLENAARSMKQHGFKVICLIGDSGGNQEGQRIIAEKLNKEWKYDGVRVIQVDQYYDRNGQTSSLVNLGIDLESIGGHAGIRDTSELLAVYPQGVRKDLLSDNRKSNFEEIGANGDSKLANSVLGKKLLEQKINAAVRQIKAETN